MPEEYSYVLHMLGAAYNVSSDRDYDMIKELHKIVEEVTGYDASPPPRRIGFY